MRHGQRSEWHDNHARHDGSQIMTTWHGDLDPAAWPRQLIFFHLHHPPSSSHHFDEPFFAVFLILLSFFTFSAAGFFLAASSPPSLSSPPLFPPPFPPYFPPPFPFPFPSPLSWRSPGRIFRHTSVTDFSSKSISSLCSDHCLELKCCSSCCHVFLHWGPSHWCVMVGQRWAKRKWRLEQNGCRIKLSALPRPNALAAWHASMHGKNNSWFMNDNEVEKYTHHSVAYGKINHEPVVEHHQTNPAKPQQGLCWVQHCLSFSIASAKTTTTIQEVHSAKF